MAKKKITKKKPITQFGTIVHAIIAVSDMEKSKKFYKNAVGLELQFEDDKKDYIQFKTQGINGFGLVKKDKPGVFGSPTTLVLMTKNVKKTVEEMENKGIRFTTKPQKMWWGGLYAEFIDPDRIRWGLVEPIKK